MDRNEKETTLHSSVRRCLTSDPTTISLLCTGSFAQWLWTPFFMPLLRIMKIGLDRALSLACLFEEIGPF